LQASATTSSAFGGTPAWGPKRAQIPVTDVDAEIPSTASRRMVSAATPEFARLKFRVAAA
jgi:hypothetical protein